MKTPESNKSVNYFSATIKSLVDLKKEYRQLALATHPDKGGATSTMQIINAEFDKLYAGWIFSKKLTEKVKTFISQSNRLEIRYTV